MVLPLPEPPKTLSLIHISCVWCDYSFICCHETGIGERALEAPAKPFEPEEADDGKEGEQA